MVGNHEIKTALQFPQYGRASNLHNTLAVCPPMSHGVFALTFLRSTCQGVEARGMLSDRVVPV
jgi:hypothetical protein